MTASKRYDIEISEEKAVPPCTTLYQNRIRSGFKSERSSGDKATGWNSFEKQCIAKPKSSCTITT